jgi:hypothetical protein
MVAYFIENMKKKYWFVEATEHRMGLKH